MSKDLFTVGNTGNFVGNMPELNALKDLLACFVKMHAGKPIQTANGTEDANKIQMFEAN